MSTLPWTPWHEVVEIRDDLKSGKLSLSMFAADLYHVVMNQAEPIYQDPREFFALTYPTFNLRGLVKDVLLRLAGKNDKAIRQLQLTYGGGKTHTLITLYHLVRDPKSLPDLPAVKEFTGYAEIDPPKSRVGVLPFDRLDPVTGMDVHAPDGTAARFKYPWTVLAFQLAGSEGLKILGMEGDTEREEPPFTNVLEDILRFPIREGLATLVLMDEVLMWARTKIGSDPVWSHRLQDFFQCLTQAATKVERCAVVASLLASDISKEDDLGRKIRHDLHAIFRREQEEGVEPVVKEDVAEVLRRRLFKAESIKDRESFPSHVVAALKGITNLDAQSKKAQKKAEDRFLESYPFHPDLTDVFYSKWTGLQGFQRTRGILRTFALALREAAQWDVSPLIAANVFLNKEGKTDISEALRELTNIAESEEYEGKKHAWTAILQGELEKARIIQGESSGLKYREIEQAILTTFFHSQPVGKKALTSELMVLLGHTRPDKIELEKALLRWVEISWFLDESGLSEFEKVPDGQKQLPKTWRLGSKPNLRQMHHDAVSTKVSPDIVETLLIDHIGNNKFLTAGASASGAKVHNLPQKPRDISDDGEFHFAVLGPSATSDSGKPNPQAKRFIDETTAKDRPRVFRNAVVLAVPSKDGLEVTRDRIRDYFGWEEVRSELKDQEIDPIRSAMLATYIDDSRKAIPKAIGQAYCIVITVSEKNEVQAFKITPGDEPLFQTIKSDSRSRIQDTAVTAEALLPGGPYELWKKGETSRRVKDLVGAFAQFPHLPKMLNRQAIIETLITGCFEGTFVLQLTRPDRSVRTFWRERPDENALKDTSLEVILPEAAELSSLPYELIAPDKLPGLWKKDELQYQDILDYFSGGHVEMIPKEGYEEPIITPKMERNVLDDIVNEAVRTEKIWLTSGPASILGEDIPTGVLTPDAILQGPPEPISTVDLLPDNLPDAWSADNTTALAIATALSKKAGKTLPWVTVKEAIDGGLKARFLELSEDSTLWPSEFTGAHTVTLRLPKEKPPPPPPQPPPDVLVAEAYLEPNQIQDLSDQIPDLTKTAVGQDLKYHVRIELKGDVLAGEDLINKINKLLQEVSDKLHL